MNIQFFPIQKLLACFLICLAGCQSPSQMPSPDPDNGGLLLPDGFKALVVADSVGRARHLAINDNGDIYIKLSSSAPKGGIVALRDNNGDGRMDVRQRFGGVPSGSRNYGTTMTIHNGYLYYSSALVLYRQKLTSESLVPTGPSEEVLIDDHAHGVHWHITKPVSFDDNGYMYVPFGAPSNACQSLDASPNGAPGGIGIDPCPELDLHGGIWRFEADKIGLRQKDGYKFATGIRSVVGMDWHPVDKRLYIMKHGRDNLHSLFPDRFSAWQNAVLPAEELIRISENANYGWPYCFYDQIKEKMILAPEYGGDGNITERCEGMDLPEFGFPAHWAPNDILFYRGDQFPERYKYGAFIAFHGSTNRAPYPQAGYFVAFLPFANGRVTGQWEIFADGFTGIDPVVNTSDAAYRPVGLAEGPDGTLYITESNRGKVWRVMYSRKRNHFNADQLISMEKRKSASHIRTPDIIEDNLQKNLTQSERLYNTFCGVCHQIDGKGAVGYFPPLTETRWVLGDKDQLIDIVLNGMNGIVEVNGESYNGVMPGFNFLSDEELALILTYVRQNFGNNANPVSKEDIQSGRQEIL
ncbi:MAG: PQQ-dependent sugar dehydrogenase [Cyclobacteriaceae bacterium]|nr:PQQ-dependent sugar dehydrogenase [Cyclobacteriaceae bacterium]